MTCNSCTVSSLVQALRALPRKKVEQNRQIATEHSRNPCGFHVGGSGVYRKDAGSSGGRDKARKLKHLHSHLLAKGSESGCVVTVATSLANGLWQAGASSRFRAQASSALSGEDFDNRKMDFFMKVSKLKNRARQGKNQDTTPAQFGASRPEFYRSQLATGKTLTSVAVWDHLTMLGPKQKKISSTSSHASLWERICGHAFGAARKTCGLVCGRIDSLRARLANQQHS